MNVSKVFKICAVSCVAIYGNSCMSANPGGLFTGFEAGFALNSYDIKATNVSLNEGESPVNIDETSNKNGFFGRVLIGYDFLLGKSFMIGVLANVGMSLGKAEVYMTKDLKKPVDANVTVGKLNIKRTFDGELSAKMGFLVTPKVEIFLKGGLALVKYDIEGYDASSTKVTDSKLSKTKMSPVVGGGINYAINPDTYFVFSYNFYFPTKLVASTNTKFKFPVESETREIKSKSHRFSLGMIFRLN